MKIRHGHNKLKATVLLTLALIGVSFGQTERFKKPAESGTTRYGVRCSLVAETRVWNHQSNTAIHVKFTNTSTEPVDLSVFPTFLLRRKPSLGFQQDSYWAPADLKADAPAPVLKKASKAGDSISPKMQRFHLDGNGELEFVVHATNLKWERLISSQWPWDEFFSRVSPGEFELMLDFEGGFHSNGVSVVVEARQ